MVGDLAPKLIYFLVEKEKNAKGEKESYILVIVPPAKLEHRRKPNSGKERGFRENIQLELDLGCESGCICDRSGCGWWK